MNDIRIARLEDLDMLITLWKEFLHNHDRDIIRKKPEFKRQLTLKRNLKEYARRYLIKKIRSRDSLVMIITQNNKPAGFCISEIKDNIPIYSSGRLGRITDIYIREQFRGRRLSSKLMDEIKKWLKKKKVLTVSLIVSDYNYHAVKIYKKWGFIEFNTEMRKDI